MSQNKKLLIRIIILIILLLLIFITSFKVGTRVYGIEESVRNIKEVEIRGRKANWYFNARILVRNEVYYGETY